MGNDKDIDITTEGIRQLVVEEPPKMILENSGDGKTVVFDQDDLVPATKRKLGDHLAKITSVAGNNPSIKVDSKDISLVDANGNPTAISDEDNNATTTFNKEYSKPTTEKSQKAVSSFKSLSNSNFLNINDDLTIDVAKGKTSNPKSIKVQDLYTDVNENLDKSKVSKIVVERQLQNNRFSGNSVYIDKNTSVLEEDSNVGISHLQQNLGTYTPKKWPDVPDNSEDVSFKVKNLKNLGLQILMESSGEYYIPQDTDNVGQVLLAKAAATAPGLARMGLRVRNNRFQAGEVANTVNPKFQKASRFPELKDNSNLSYGSVNNPLVPFNAISTSNSQAAAVILAATIGAVLQALSLAVDKMGPSGLSNPVGALLSSFGSGGDKNNFKTNREIRQQRLGKYSFPSTPGESSKEQDKYKYSLSGLVAETKEDYAKCVSHGLVVFFDAPEPGLLSQLGGSAMGAANAATGGLLEALGIDTPYDNIVDAPGFYNVILRMLIQSTVSDVMGLIGPAASLIGHGSQMENIGAPGALDINRTIGLDADPTNLLNAIGNLKNSRIIKFMNIMASLGDLRFRVAIGEPKDKKDLTSSIDDIDDQDYDHVEIDTGVFPNPASLIKKDRLSDKITTHHAGTIAWSSNTIRSMYLLPKSLIEASVKYQGNSLAAPPQKDKNFLSGEKDKNRINASYVEAVERELDSCYMPFYFHDVRTNEIISFHAFMESVNDSWTAEYNESEAFGRVGKIYSYKNTNREISFSFKVVATSRNDFSDMWYKINRLIMLLCPQYTAGRSIDTGNGKFIQPFSQLISNSPLIRVRLGDLFKTNYSEFDLARMFGLGTEQFDLRKSVTVIKDNPENIKYKKDLDNRFSQNPPILLEGDKINLQTTGIFRNGNVIAQKKFTGIRTLYGEYVGVDPKNSNRFLFKLDNSTNDPISLLYGPAATVGYSIGYNVDYYEKNFPDDTLSSVVDLTEDRDAFFNPESNPIIKSFDSVAGQGLPGFIKSLSFDWSDARWETEELNHRAPMWCKIDISFSPIFELSPGLDSSGAPIGMPYNVGSIMNLLKSSKRKSREYAQKKFLDRRSSANTPEENKENNSNKKLIGV